jgi:hypothetical protein
MPARKLPRVYVETSVWNFMFSDDAPEHEAAALQQIHEIRERLHEERQSWTEAERREQVERVGEELIERLGLRRLARQAQRPIRRVS